MSKGVLLIAHNSEYIDYGKLAVLSASLAKKNLKVPVSLITDKWTKEWMNDSGSLKQFPDLFDQIIETSPPRLKNQRRLHDGFDSRVVPFNNENRNLIWDLTPYDRTLLIDVDFLIFTDQLNEFWDVDSSILISGAINDVQESRTGILDKWISVTGSPLLWATTVMFTKDKESKFFFELVEFIKNNYNYYADLYRFNPKQYRNDISFSIARHILNGFASSDIYMLPNVVSIIDKDILFDVKKDGSLICMIDNPLDSGSYRAMSIRDTDIHVMNKQSIIRNYEKLIELA